MKILKRLKHSDLYTGIIVASKQNPEYLYELILTDNHIKYKAVAFINNGIIEKKEDGYWHTINSLQSHLRYALTDIWCETEESRKINPASMREDRLKELGI